MTPHDPSRAVDVARPDDAPYDTLDLQAAARCAWDIVVVGAGPAGAFAAHELARRGLSVLLVERARFPRRKVCGCCVNPRALHVLEQAGLGALAAQLHAVPLRHLHLAAARRAAVVSLPGGASVSREAFDSALVRAACARGAQFLSGTAAASGGEPDGEARRQVLLCRGAEHATVHAAIVLAADGLAGRFLDGAPTQAAPRARLGAGAIAEDAPASYAAGTVYMACAPAGYVGLVRLQDGRLDIAAALAPEALRETGGGHAAGAAAERVLAVAGLPPVPGLRELPWLGTPALTRRARRLAAPRAFLLGDACGYVEPFTGEGIAWALASARAVVPLAEAGVRAWDAGLCAAWEAEWRRVVAGRQLLCRSVARVLRHPALVTLGVRLLSARPGLGAPVLARLARSRP